MSWRVTPHLKGWLDQVAAENGRSLAQEIELRLEMSRETERGLLDIHDIAFGAATSGLMLLIGLLGAEARRHGAESWGADPEADAVIAAACARVLGILFGVEIEVVRPGSITEQDWERRIAIDLQPLYGICDYLASDPRPPGRILIRQICERLGEVVRGRLAALPAGDRPPTATRDASPAAVPRPKPDASEQ